MIWYVNVDDARDEESRKRRLISSGLRSLAYEGISSVGGNQRNGKLTSLILPLNLHP